MGQNLFSPGECEMGKVGVGAWKKYAQNGKEDEHEKKISFIWSSCKERFFSVEKSV